MLQLMSIIEIEIGYFFINGSKNCFTLDIFITKEYKRNTI